MTDILTEYRLTGSTGEEREPFVALTAVRWGIPDVTWRDCEGKSQIRMRSTGHAITISVSRMHVPEECKFPHPEALTTFGDTEKEAANTSAYKSFVRTFEHRLAGTWYRDLTCREAIEVLLHLKSEGIVFPDAAMDDLAAQIEGEEKATPKAAEFLASREATLNDVEHLSGFINKLNLPGD